MTPSITVITKPRSTSGWLFAWFILWALIGLLHIRILIIDVQLEALEHRIAALENKVGIAKERIAP